MKTISFIEQDYDSVIVLNTELNNFDVFDKLGSALILAADRAGITLLNNNIVPDFIIGDFDSYQSGSESKFNFPKEKMIVDLDQETNDFEKSLNFANSLNKKNILIIGIHGGDYEHSLNNWSVLSKYSQKINLTIYENGRYGFCINSSFILQTEIGELISLIPVKSSKITTEGLKWNLKNEILELGIRDGLHNIAIEKQIKVEFEYGELFVFCNSQFPKMRLIN